MSERPNRWMLQLPETTDRGVDTGWDCNCHCLCLLFLAVGHVCSGFVIIAGASGFGLGVGWFSRPLRGVGVLALPDAGLDTTRCVESFCVIPLGAGVLRLLVPGVAVGVSIGCCCVADWVEVTR